MTTPEDVLAFWLDEVGPKGWYAGEEIDALVRDRFLDAWDRAAEGGCALWLTYPTGTLAYIVLTDQFPRNMHRGKALAFSTDSAARAAAKMAIGRDWDMRIDEPARQFFYMPLMHSENLCDQDRCVRLMKTRMPQTGAENLLHAKAHREIIRRFGRFPFRNAALGRSSGEEEQAFLDNGGYGRIVNDLRAAA
jgi:uncharacterized protein (DUF924 family)